MPKNPAKLHPSADPSHLAQHFDELGNEFVKELDDFFVNFHEMRGLKYKVLDVRGPRTVGAGSRPPLPQ